MAANTADDIYDLVLGLPMAERLRLVEKIAHDLAGTPTPAPFDWATLGGAAPGLLGGHDAQEWVTRSRRESDQAREPHTP